MFDPSQRHADNTRIRSLLIVEDEPLLRELLSRALEVRGFIVTTAGTPSDARRAFLAADPDGVIMDVDLGPGPNGFELAEALLDLKTGAVVIFLTNLPDPRFAGRRQGGLPPGIAYLNKRSVTDLDLLVQTIESALRGTVDASMRHDLDPRRPFAGLTPVQVETLRLVALGKSNSQIAAARGTKERAVEAAVTRVFEALGVSEDTDANHRVVAARRFFRWAGSPLPLVPDAHVAEHVDL